MTKPAKAAFRRAAEDHLAWLDAVGRRRTRALILDPALHSLGGHHYNAVQRLSEELSALGIRHDILGSTCADAGTRDVLRTKPWFSCSIYGRSAWTHREFAQRVEVTGREIRRYFRWKHRKPDLVILPCCDQVLTLALARYIGLVAPRWQPHILLWLLFAPKPHASIDDPSLDGLFMEYRQAFVALKAAIVHRCRLNVYCETESMAQAYREILDANVAVAPGPTLVNASHGAAHRAEIGRPTVVCLGHANAPKGYGLLPRALERVLQVRPEVRFMIHGMRGHLDVDRDLSTFEALARLGPQVVVNSKVLTSDEYISWLRQADLVLLPYDPRVYKTRGSGIFGEATVLGIPMVITSGCGFAQAAFAEGRAVPIEGYDGEGVAEATLTALGQLPMLAERARRASQAVRASDTTKDILVGLLGDMRKASASRGLWAQLMPQRL